MLARVRARPRFPVTSYDAYDEALAWLAPYGPDLAWGFTSHAPMVVEALCVMDRGDAVAPWLESYRRGLVERPQPRGAVGWILRSRKVGKAFAVQGQPMPRRYTPLAAAEIGVE